MVSYDVVFVGMVFQIFGEKCGSMCSDIDYVCVHLTKLTAANINVTSQ